jgi:menaquinol-cytochrome c reductase iron-sulfur subunit
MFGAMAGRNTDGRRGFLGVITGALGAAMGAIAIIPGLGFLASPLRRQTVTGGGDPVRVASPDEVRPGKPLRVNVVGQRHDAWLRLDRVKLGACWLVRAQDGAPIRAFSTVCPHLGCGVEWNDKTGRFDCPCHDSSFDSDGRCLGGPSPRGLDELEVIAGEDIKVRYRRFKTGSPKKEPIG